MQDVCSTGINLFRVLATWLQPVLPAMVSDVEALLNIPPVTWDAVNTPLTAHKINRFRPLMTRVEPKQIDPRAIKAMAEAGIDISGQVSKDIDSLGNMEFDYVVTLCDNAKESCPFFPTRTRLMHKGFDDPPKLAVDTKDEDKAMNPYRRVRDEIKAFVEELSEALAGDQEEER